MTRREQVLARMNAAKAADPPAALAPLPTPETRPAFAGQLLARTRPRLSGRPLSRTSNATPHVVCLFGTGRGL